MRPFNLNHAATVPAALTGGSGTATRQFSRVVAGTDLDLDGIALVAASALSGGSIVGSSSGVAATRTLTVPIERTAGAQVVDTLREALRERRQVLKTEARQLRQDWQESETLRSGKSSPARPSPEPANP